MIGYIMCTYLVKSFIRTKISVAHHFETVSIIHPLLRVGATKVGRPELSKYRHRLA